MLMLLLSAKFLFCQLEPEQNSKTKAQQIRLPVFCQTNVGYSFLQPKILFLAAKKWSLSL